MHLLLFIFFFDEDNVTFENEDNEDKLDSKLVPPVLSPTISLSPPSPNTPKKF